MERTRVRRWRTATLAGWLIAATLAVGPIGHALTADASSRRTPATSYVVKPGDTLWTVARSLAPGEDPRDVVARIVAANHLGGTSALQPGRSLTVPLG